MHAPGSLPPYPPERDRWHYPPPAVGRRWLLVALVAPLLAVVALVAALGVLGVMGERDARGFIDDERSIAVVERECDLMTSTVQGLRATGPAQRRAEVLADQNEAVRTMLKRIRELPSRVRAADRPLEAWLADWQRVLAARERWAEAVGRGFTGGFDVPRDDDGERLTRRMDAAAEQICSVPKALLDPYSVDDRTV